jgi:hypothetical protein
MIQWIIQGNDKLGSFLYEACNARTRKGAIMHHAGSLGMEWKECLAQGDKAVKIEVKEVVPMPRRKKGESDFYYNLRRNAAVTKHWPQWKKDCINGLRSE